MAGLLLVESQASNVVDRSTLQGFLSKYMPSGSDAPESSLSDYEKFITPSLNRVKQDFHPPTIADREEKQAVQKLVTNDSSNPITMSAIGIGLLSTVTMLGVRLQRRLQPATVLASSGGLGPLMPMNTASALGDNVMEMKSQDPHKVNSSRAGWGQLSSQNSHPLTNCYAGEQIGSESRIAATTLGIQDVPQVVDLTANLPESVPEHWLGGPAAPRAVVEE